MRKAEIKRKTNETDIAVSVNLDGTGTHDMATGIGFLDHMLDQLSKHSLIDMKVRAKGDLHIDFHHTAEDVGIALGEAVKKALGDKKGIRRYASADLVMDGTLTRKQNGIDDFIACAEHLIARRYTQPRRLAAYGASAGGLLVAAATTQRPDLFSAVVLRPLCREAFFSPQTAPGQALEQRTVFEN